MNIDMTFWFKKEKWEALCKHCGSCCYKKEVYENHLITDSNEPCKYFNTDINICIVYENRFKICRECRKMTIFHALFSSYLPDTCGYVEKFRFWRKLFKKG